MKIITYFPKQLLQYTQYQRARVVNARADIITISNGLDIFLHCYWRTRHALNVTKYHVKQISRPNYAAVVLPTLLRNAIITYQIKSKCT